VTICLLLLPCPSTSSRCSPIWKRLAFCNHSVMYSRRPSVHILFELVTEHMMNLVLDLSITCVTSAFMHRLPAKCRINFVWYVMWLNQSYFLILMKFCFEDIRLELNLRFQFCYSKALF
jgi:hypothetical protein